MPYIITTERAIGYALNLGQEAVSRRAVATLDEARGAVLESACRATGDPKARGAQWPEIPEAGGTVGPLPDGSVIEVERVSWPKLGQRANRPYRFAEYEQTIDAYNAAQS